MKWAALLLLVGLGGLGLAACEDTYGDEYGYDNGPGYYHHDYDRDQHRRGYYDSNGYWHAYRYDRDRDRDRDRDYD